jgi:hypothetical protein
MPARVAASIRLSAWAGASGVARFFFRVFGVGARVRGTILRIVGLRARIHAIVFRVLGVMACIPRWSRIDGPGSGVKRRDPRVRNDAAVRGTRWSFR